MGNSMMDQKNGSGSGSSKSQDLNQPPASSLSLPNWFGVAVRLPAVLTSMVLDVPGGHSDDRGQPITLILCGSFVHCKHLVHTFCMPSTVLF